MDQTIKSPEEVRLVGSNAPGRPSKLRRGLTAVAATAFAVSVGAPVTYALLSGNGNAIPGAAEARSFVSELMNRSPGARTAAELTKTKRAATSRMLSSADMSKDPFLTTVPADLVSVVSPMQPLMDIVLPTDVVPMVFPAESTAPIASGGVFSPGVVGGGGGGGGGGGVVLPPDTNVPPIDTVVPAIPEPSTWATMLLGFVMTGWAIRRRRTGRVGPLRTVRA